MASLENTNFRLVPHNFPKDQINKSRQSNSFHMALFIAILSIEVIRYQEIRRQD